MSNVQTTNLGEFYRGKTMEIVFTFSDSSGNPLDITGWTLTFVAGPSPADSASVTALLTITDGPNGVAILKRVPAASEQLGNWQYQITGTDGSGDAHVYLEGGFILERALDE